MIRRGRPQREPDKGSFGAKLRLAREGAGFDKATDLEKRLTYDGTPLITDGMISGAELNLPTHQLSGVRLIVLSQVLGDNFGLDWIDRYNESIGLTGVDPRIGDAVRKLQLLSPSFRDFLLGVIENEYDKVREIKE